MRARPAAAMARSCPLVGISLPTDNRYARSRGRSGGRNFPDTPHRTI